MSETTSSTNTNGLSIQRRTDRRVVAGLSAGIGDALGVDAAYVRAAFLILALAGGVGIVLYGLGWVATIDRASDTPAEPIIAASASENSRAIGFQLVIVGIVVLASGAGFALHPSIMWPVGMVALGVANVWAQGDTRQRQWLQGIVPGTEGPSRGSRRETLTRLAIGGALVCIGLTLALTSTEAFRQAGIVVLAVSITLIGLSLVLAPWIWRLWRQLTNERRERIRSEEKTEIAAHLHDSVLQTLALIQASADPEQQAVLARIQERELRSWLFGGEGSTGATLKVMMDAAAAEIERIHKIPVEVVTVGDCEINTASAGVVAATREALINAAKHSGEHSISLYTEATEELIEVFITDQGIGFTPQDVEPDRHGIAESIVGRMQRHGGAATITSSPGEGTEVHLSLPVRNGQ